MKIINELFAKPNPEFSIQVNYFQLGLPKKPRFWMADSEVDLSDSRRYIPVHSGFVRFQAGKSPFPLVWVAGGAKALHICITKRDQQPLIPSQLAALPSGLFSI
ncbi:hypothetical protein [Rufibacter roseolus]|uniref:hypothetical protein n=1 Tax=Rufibacter roseolus TaxID=2817375 RepID=UPI001B303EF5|nr:hypothetical protein [Rufibacter roseolus]